MRTALIAGLCMAACLTCAAQGEGDPGAPPQIVLNGGFERGDDARAADWGLWPPAGRDEGVSSLRDSEVRRSGEYSGRLRVTDPEFDGICTWHHRATPVEPGQEIVLSFWVRAQDVVDRAGCDVQLRSGPTEVVGSRGTPTMKGTFDWRRVTHRFVVPPGADHICIVPYLWGTGTVWFDDIEAWGTPTIEATRVETPPEIDGRLTEACWDAGRAVTGFALADGTGLPERATWAWAAHDDDHLYFAFRGEKKPGDTLRKEITERDGPVWTDDAVEVFLNPRGDREEYYQFVVNALGTQYDSRRTDATWNANWRAAAHETDGEWTVEMAIPVAELPIDLRVGDTWRVNFGRGDKSAGEASAWSCTFGGFHNPGRFGTLAGLGLDLRPFWVRDAQARLAQAREAHDRATEGLDPAGAPAWIAAPVIERAPRITAALDALEEMVATPGALTEEARREAPARFAQVAAELADLQAAGIRLRAFNAWREGRDHEPRFGLAVASPMVKVFREGQDFGGEVSGELRLRAARNEFEGGQVVAVSLSEEDIADCRAAVGALVGPGGATIGEEHLKLSLVGYVKTAQPGYETAHVGEWPDPLLPNGPFTLQAGRMQPVWLRVYVPPGTPAGEYRGTLTVSGGGDELAMAVALEVFDFELPRRLSLATPFGCAPQELSQWYTGSPDYMTHLPPEVFMRWNDFLLDYRLTPTRVGQSYIRETRDEDGRVEYDYSITDRCIEAVADRLPRRGVNMAGVGHFGWHSARGGVLSYVEDDPRSGARCARVKWPRTESWASLSRPLAGRVLADRGCRAFRFWVRAPDATLEGERITAFVNIFPNRWVTTFPLGGEDWTEVRIPIEQYRHNQTGASLTLEDLAACDSFQFVISNKARPLEYFMDDIVAECEDGDVVIDDFELESELVEVQQRVASHMRHWKEKGWFDLGHVYGWDEARPEEYEQVIAAYRKALEAEPDAPIMQTYYVNRTPHELVGTVQVWCAITSIYDEGFLEERRRLGEDVWLYVCCGPRPPYANFFIDQPGSDHRILFWQAWQENATGVLYWRVNYWHGLLPTAGRTEVQWPDEPWDLEQLATWREFKVNGDGWLVYPWHDWTPLASVRLENVRDGIEDYEYLALLGELAPGDDLTAVGEDISESFTRFTRDPRVLEARREGIARRIVELGGGG